MSLVAVVEAFIWISAGEVQYIPCFILFCWEWHCIWIIKTDFFFIFNKEAYFILLFINDVVKFLFWIIWWRTIHQPLNPSLLRTWRLLTKICPRWWHEEMHLMVIIPCREILWNNIFHYIVIVIEYFLYCTQQFVFLLQYVWM